MGYNSTVIVYNDALGEIKNDPKFGEKMALAIMQTQRGKPVDIPSGHHSNAAVALETHHADIGALIVVGCNYGKVLHQAWVGNADFNNLDWEEKFLKQRLKDIQALKKKAVAQRNYELGMTGE